MSRVDNQRRLFLELIEELRPHWHHDPAQPQRLADWLARHRAGSRDRRLYRELCYTAWRILPWIEDTSAELLVRRVASFASPSKATAPFIEAFADPTVTSAPPGPPESLLPTWLGDECPAVLQDPTQRDALLSRAPLWIRLQTAQPPRVAAEFDSLGIAHSPSALLPDAWQVAADAPVLNTEAFRRGDFEIQDLGSQALLASLPGALSGHWLDACAGAGGKTLQLARRLGHAGRVTAHDIRGPALRELEQRAQRAGLDNVTIERAPSGPFDGVLVDAPCSGSGTWRRAPHLKWTTSHATIAAAAERQQFVLGKFAAMVRAGGTLVYATCSLCHRENEAVVDAFLEHHREYRPLPLRPPGHSSPQADGRWTFLPAELDSDAYFVAAFQRS
ncbi:RsmB/NOP family class I SAM-dependent RNA methyltransferase [Actomonas aquatica]|uniref:RsmB/NOP family class I SAM-dependent RNA methyltransferase n=1 Tax=Actomonas aquatica TaxID=2866162 RepID=A0ABZ1C9E6_9BACT|nr:RsmB/NOP family class I SAM-dependent RNA methyltransferase [Opitutus sp. WL0086]WRQ87922.1 RsmB/NOP family class I SAM-dependent RNA methyltransferase [Opitutus sp. WL0086]